MKEILKSIIRRSKICSKIAQICDADPYVFRHYGQNGEDLFVLNFFGRSYVGVYVDIGAHHPVRFSNTNLLYRAGWRGINIDPLPGGMASFDRERPQDVNLELCVSRQLGKATYYSFAEPAYNTLSAERAARVVEEGVSLLVESVEVYAAPLSDVLCKYLPPQASIDLMTVDVETMELDVLQTNDWNRFLPKMVIIESLMSKYADISAVNEDPAVRFLVNKGYVVIGKMMHVVYLVYEK